MSVLFPARKITTSKGIGLIFTSTLVEERDKEIPLRHSAGFTPASPILAVKAT